MTHDADAPSAPIARTRVTSSSAFRNRPRRAPLQMKDRIGGRYTVEQVLGEGGMASVYRVSDLATGRVLALKQLRSDASAKIALLFAREYHTLASLRHPNIVRVYEYGSHAG